jgi:hypothetical protein
MSVPIYLSGAIKAELWKERPDLFGALLTPQMGNRIPEGLIWGADNGCFNPKVSARFKADEYLAWLASRPGRDSCLFASAPDVFANARATLERSLPVLPGIRALGFRAAFVGQDGMGFLNIPWNEFDVFFVGGTTSWKLGTAAQRLCCEARARGKWIHVGRVNSEKRLVHCAEKLEADSVDGTFVRFAPDVNVARLQGWYGCPDCRQLCEPDEFGLHEGCPALAGCVDRDPIDRELSLAELNARINETPINTGDRLEELR